MKNIKTIIIATVCTILLCSCSQKADYTPNTTPSPLPEGTATPETNIVFPEYDENFAVTDEHIINAELSTKFVINSSDIDLFTRLDTMNFPDGDIFRFIYSLGVAENKLTLLSPGNYIKEQILYVPLSDAQNIAKNIYGVSNWHFSEKYNDAKNQFEIPLDVGSIKNYDIENPKSYIDGNIIRVEFDLLKNNSAAGQSMLYEKIGTGCFEFICSSETIMLKNCSYKSA